MASADEVTERYDELDGDGDMTGKERAAPYPSNVRNAWSVQNVLVVSPFCNTLSF